MMKKLLLASAASALVAGAASAADLPRRAEPPPVFTPVPVFTWTVFSTVFQRRYSRVYGAARAWPMKSRHSENLYSRVR